MKGYFRKRGNTWSYTIDTGIDPQTGKRKQKTKSGFPTKKEAQLAAAKLMQELDEGLYIDEQNILFKDFAKEWLRLYESSGKVKVSTVRLRHYEIQVLMSYLAHMQLKKITKKHIQDALLSFKDKYSANYISGILTTCKMIFEKAVEMDVIKNNPTKYVQKPVIQRSVEELENTIDIPKYLEKEELSIFLKTAKEKGKGIDYMVFLLLSYSGIRVGELLALKWKDIDFNTGEINITKTLFNPKCNLMGFTLLPPKTKKSRRTIDVPASVISELEKYKALQNKVKMQYRDIYYDEDFVFTKLRKNPGYPEIPNAIGKRMNILLKLANLNTSLTPHSLRHTHTSLLAEAGVDLTQIMERLGHANDQITKNVYLHVTKTMKKEASEKFAKLMENL